MIYLLYLMIVPTLEVAYFITKGHGMTGPWHQPRPKGCKQHQPHLFVVRRNPALRVLFRLEETIPVSAREQQSLMDAVYKKTFRSRVLQGLWQRLQES